MHFEHITIIIIETCVDSPDLEPHPDALPGDPEFYQVSVTQLNRVDKACYKHLN